MLSLIAFLLTIVTLGLIALQVLYVLGYVSWMESSSSHYEHDSEKHFDLTDTTLTDAEGDQDHLDAVYQPPAAVVLCLKGDDANLDECLTGLISQDYPNYQLFIIVDSERDPAVDSVARFFDGVEFEPNVQALHAPATTCSLKCSAITQAIRSIPSRYEVIALIDADTVPDQAWLADIVRPLGDATIGATTGNRWYTPTDGRLGSWVRKIWNAAAIVQMQQYQIPWGGALAMRTETIERCGLVKHWRNAFCEDTSMVSRLKEQKLKVHRVPNLILENTESVSLPAAFEWIARQLLTVRLHHSKWTWVMAHAVASGLVAIGAPIAIAAMFYFGQTRGVWTLLQAYIAWQIVNSVLLWLIERSNRQAIEARESFNRLPVPESTSATMQILGTLTTQLLYPFTAWQASAMEKVTWRGVGYKLRGNGAVQLIEKSDKAWADRNAPASGVDLLSTDEGSGDGDDDEESNPKANVYLPSRFSKRSRN